MVVDLAVADEPDVTGGAGERLMAAVDIDDRQAPVAEPRAVDADLALVVGPAMQEPVEHAPGLARGVHAVDRRDAAHQAPTA